MRRDYELHVQYGHPAPFSVIVCNDQIVFDVVGVLQLLRSSILCDECSRAHIHVKILHILLDSRIKGFLHGLQSTMMSLHLGSCVGK